MYGVGMNKKAIQIPYNEHFRKKCQFASESGFQYISVNFNDTPDPSDATYDKAPAHINGILKEYGLAVVQTHLYYYYPLSSADAIEEALEHRILREIEVSGKIGAPWCVWHPRYYKSGDWRTDWNAGEYHEERTFYYNHRTVPRYLEQAARFHTGIAIENLFGSMMYGGYETLARLCDSFCAENVGICWDTGHAHLMDLHHADAIRFMGERIKCTHIHNNFKNADLHLPPDAGTIPWDQIMQAFQDIGYEGPLTLETHCLYPQDDQLLRDFARYNYNCLEFLERMKNKA